MGSFKLDFRNLEKPTFQPLEKKFFDKVCSVCGGHFKAIRQWTKSCSSKCRVRKLRETRDPERAVAKKRCKGKCEACRKPYPKLFFRGTDKGKKMLCGHCNSMYSQDLFFQRVGDPAVTRTKLWDRVQNSLDEIPANTGGIYLIRCKELQREFVGSAKNVFRICKKHIEALQAEEHPNSYLQADWSSLGRDTFEFLLLKEIVDYSMLEHEREKAITERKSYYNLM